MIIVLDVRIHYLQRLSTTQYLKEFFFSLQNLHLKHHFPL